MCVIFMISPLNQFFQLPNQMQTIVFSCKRISQSGLMVQTQRGVGDRLGAVVVQAEKASPGEVLQLQKR